MKNKSFLAFIGILPLVSGCQGETVYDLFLLLTLIVIAAALVGIFFTLEDIGEYYEKARKRDFGS